MRNPGTRFTLLTAAAALAVPASGFGAPAVNATPADGAVMPGMKNFPITWTLPPATGAAQTPFITITRDGVPAPIGQRSSEYIGYPSNTWTGVQPTLWQPAGTYTWFTTLAGEKSTPTTFRIRAAHRVVRLSARKNGSWVFRTLRVTSNVQGFTTRITLRANGKVVSRQDLKPNKNLAWTNTPFDLSANMNCRVCTTRASQRQTTPVQVEVKLIGGGVTVVKRFNFTWR